MDKHRTPRLKLTGISPERSECMSDAMTSVMTPRSKFPIKDLPSSPYGVDLHLHSRSSMSLKIRSDDFNKAYARWPIEEGELNLFDPDFGNPRQAVSIADSITNRWSLPRLKWCAYCKGTFSTSVEYVPTSKTFWSSMGILLAGGMCGCFMAPYYINRCKKPRLLCSKCKRPV